MGIAERKTIVVAEDRKPSEGVSAAL